MSSVRFEKTRFSWDIIVIVGLCTAFLFMFSICWCFDCNMHASCFSSDVGKAIFCSWLAEVYFPNFFLRTLED